MAKISCVFNMQDTHTHTLGFRRCIHFSLTWLQIITTSRHTHTHTNTHFPKGEIGKHFTPVVDYIDKKHKAVPSFIKNTREPASEIFTFSKDEGGRTEIRGESQRFLKIHSDKSTKRYLSSNLLNSQPHQIIRIKRQSQVPLYYSTLLTGHLRTECECVHAFLLKETFKPKNMKN